MKTIAGQISIFSYLEELNMTEPEEKPFCWDEDVNEIHRRLVSLASEYGLQVGDSEWSIWSHVPQYGYRMDLNLKVTREVIKCKEFLKSIDDIIEYAKSREVELSPMYGACFFFQGEETAQLTFYSTFLDKTRRKRK